MIIGICGKSGSGKSTLAKEITNIYGDKAIHCDIDKIIQNNKNKIIILDWLLLPKSKYFNNCCIKILLDIPYEIRKQRAIARDNITEEAFDLREKASYKYNNDLFDIIISNNSKEEYERIVKLI